MRFLIDAQLPRRLALFLNELEYDAIHTLDLADGNSTTDLQIIEIATEQVRVIVSKDSDFIDSHYLRGKPEKLLLVSTGNIRNTVLEALVRTNLQDVVAAFEEADVVELTLTKLIVHG